MEKFFFFFGGDRKCTDGSVVLFLCWMGFKHCGKIHNLIECVDEKNGKRKQNHRTLNGKYDEHREAVSSDFCRSQIRFDWASRRVSIFYVGLLIGCETFYVSPKATH